MKLYLLKILHFRVGVWIIKFNLSNLCCLNLRKIPVMIVYLVRMTCIPQNDERGTLKWVITPTRNTNGYAPQCFWYLKTYSKKTEI